MKKPLVSTLTFILTLSLVAPITAQTNRSVTPASEFDKMVSKNSIAPLDLIALYLASRLTSSEPSTVPTVAANGDVKSSFIAVANNTRTDLQVGANSGAAAATSVVEKTGAADLLSLAIERGAVNSTTNGTALTLQSTPYMLLGFVGVRDSPQNWRDYASLRHIALAATFSSGSDVTAKGDFSSIDSGEVKWTVLGNRSPRDAALTDAFLKVATLPVQTADETKTAVCTQLNNFVTTAQIIQFATDSAPVALDAQRSTKLRAQLDSIFKGLNFTDNNLRAAASACASATIAAEEKANGESAMLQTMTAAYLALNKTKQLSLAVSSHRDPKTSDFATVKVLYGYDAAPKLSVNLNAEGNFNQHTKSASGAQLHQWRSFTVEAGSTLGRFNDDRFDATFSGKLWRNQDTANRNVGVVQIKANVYISSTMTLPLSLSYANKPVDNIKKGWQFNLGLGSLLDSVLSRSLSASP
jgi:hypothetical protein